MNDDISTKDDNQVPDETPIIDDSFVREYSANPEVIEFMKRKFKRLSQSGAISLVKQLLYKNVHIKIDTITEKWRGLFHYNRQAFDKNKEVKPEILKDLRRSLNGFLLEIGRDIPEYDENKYKDWEIRDIGGDRCFVVNKSTLYKKVRKLTCDEGGKVVYRYNFDDPDMKSTVPGNEKT